MSPGVMSACSIEHKKDCFKSMERSTFTQQDHTFRSHICQWKSNMEHINSIQISLISS